MNIRYILLILLIEVLPNIIDLCACANLEHFVEQLPDYPKEIMKSKWYSGHYNVSLTKHLHYLFIESMNEPKTDPIMVFFEGGPGGASLTIAFLGGGPLKADAEEGFLTFIDMPISYCSNASVLFLDNPAGIGFSYAKRKIDDSHNDFSF